MKEPNDKISFGRKRVATYLPKEETRISFLPNRTALLIIDPVNDFLSEGGAGWELTETTVKKHDVVGHLKQAIEGARLHSIPVLFRSDGLHRRRLRRRAAATQKRD
jgi:nicotinamidase-related amidase